MYTHIYIYTEDVEGSTSRRSRIKREREKGMEDVGRVLFGWLRAYKKL